MLNASLSTAVEPASTAAHIGQPTSVATSSAAHPAPTIPCLDTGSGTSNTRAFWDYTCRRVRVDRLTDELGQATLQTTDRITLPVPERDAARILIERLAVCGRLTTGNATALYVGLRKFERVILQRPALGAHAETFREPCFVSQWLELLFALRKFADSRPPIEADVLLGNLTVCRPSYAARVDAMRAFLGQQVQAPLREIPLLSDFRRYNETHWLESWIDWPRAAALTPRPIQLMNAIFAQGGVRPPLPLTDIEDPEYGAHHEQFLFSAFALALNRIETGAFLQGFVDDRSNIDHQGLLRSARAAVSKAVTAQQLANRLMGLDAAASVPGWPRHDGFSFCEARGLTPAQVRDSWIAASPVVDATASAKPGESIWQRLAQLGESTVYTIGTPEQSMHSTLLRVYAANALAIPTNWHDKQAMRESYNETVRQWTNKSIDYPVAPELLAAMHLQASYGIDFEQLATELNLATDAASAPSEPIESAAQSPAEPPLHAPQSIGCRTDPDKAACAIEWLRGRITARFDGPSPFNETEAAVHALQKSGHSLEEIHRHHPHGLFINRGLLLTPVKIGHTLLEVFLEAARQTASMTANTQLDPKALMHAEISDYSRQMITSGWLHQHTLELLRASDAPITAIALKRRMIKELAARMPAFDKTAIDVDVADLLLDFAPVVGPSRNLIHSTKAGQPLDTVWHGFMLGVDLVWFGAPVFRSALRAVKALGGRLTDLPSATQMTLRATGRMADLFGSVRNGYALEEAATPLVPAPHIYAIAHAARVPKMLETLAGAPPGSSWRSMEGEHFIVRLSNDGRLARLERADSHYRELDMSTGTPIDHADPVFLDPLDHSYYSRPALRTDPFLPPLLPDSATFAERITIAQAQPLLHSRADYSRKAARRALLRMFVLDMERATATLIANHLSATLEHSWDFVRLLNFAERRKETWRMVIENHPLGPHTSFESKKIVLLPPEQRESLSPYMSARGATPTSFKQAIDHELMHALTGELDPDRSKHGLMHRGVVSYLAARIAFDRGDISLPRVMYPHPLPPHLATEALPHENPSRLFVQAAEQAAIEDRLLDWRLQAGRPRATRDEIVFGQPISERPVISGFDTVAAMMIDDKSISQMSLGELNDLSPHFEFGGTPAERAYGRHFFASVAGTKALLDTWAPWAASLSRPSHRWTLTWRAAGSSTRKTSGHPLFEIDERAHEIVFYSEGTLYLSETDIRAVEPHRQLLLGLLSISLPVLADDDRIVARAANAYLSRSSLTTLVDDVLCRLNFRYPRQIARQLAGPSETAIGHRLTETISDVRRAADKEDSYLATRWIGNSLGRKLAHTCTLLR